MSRVPLSYKEQYLLDIDLIKLYSFLLSINKIGVKSIKLTNYPWMNVIESPHSNERKDFCLKRHSL